MAARSSCRERRTRCSTTLDCARSCGTSGPHRLKDLLAPDPALPAGHRRSAGRASRRCARSHRSNLPVAAWPLLGRDTRARRAPAARRPTGARLVTLTGPGGTGKTRLALQSRPPTCRTRFPDGVFFVPLAALRVGRRRRPAVAEALGLQRRRRSRRLARLADRRWWCSTTSSSCGTSRASWRRCWSAARWCWRRRVRRCDLSAEHEMPGLSARRRRGRRALRDPRGRAAGRRVDADATVRRDLPATRQPAARNRTRGARSKLLAPAAMLQRLDATLRAAWGRRRRPARAAADAPSDDRLEPRPARRAGARAAFRRLSVFRGSFTPGERPRRSRTTDLDAIGTLVDQSLVVARPDGRLLLLETIRTFGLEQLDGGGETRDVELRHARFFLGRARGAGPPLPDQRASPRCATGTWTEEENLRTMLDRLIQHAPGEAARAGYLLGRYQLRWGSMPGGASAPRDPANGRPARRLAAGARARTPCDARRPARRLDGGGGASRNEAEALTSNGRNPAIHVDALGWLTIFSSRAGDHEAGVRLCAPERLRRRSTSTGRPTSRRGTTWVRRSGSAGEVDEARGILREVVVETHAIGDVGSEAFAAYNLGELELRTGLFEDAAGAFEHALRANEQFDDVGLHPGRGSVAGSRSRAWTAARMPARSSSKRSSCSSDRSSPWRATSGRPPTPWPWPAIRRTRRAPRGFVVRRPGNVVPGRGQVDELRAMHADRLEQPLIAAIGPAAWAEEREAGRSLSLDDAIEIAQVARRTPMRRAPAWAPEARGCVSVAAPGKGLTRPALLPHPPPPDDCHHCQLADVYAWAAPSFGGRAPRLPRADLQRVTAGISEPRSRGREPERFAVLLFSGPSDG